MDAGLLKRIYLDDFDLSVDYHLTFQKNKLFSGATRAFLELLPELRLFNHVDNWLEWSKNSAG